MAGATCCLDADVARLVVDRKVLLAKIKAGQALNDDERECIRLGLAERGARRTCNRTGASASRIGLGLELAVSRGCVQPLCISTPLLPLPATAGREHGHLSAASVSRKKAGELERKREELQGCIWDAIDAADSQMNGEPKHILLLAIQEIDGLECAACDLDEEIAHYNSTAGGLPCPHRVQRSRCPDPKCKDAGSLCWHNLPRRRCKQCRKQRVELDSDAAITITDADSNADSFDSFDADELSFAAPPLRRAWPPGSIGEVLVLYSIVPCLLLKLRVLLYSLQ